MTIRSNVLFTAATAVAVAPLFSYAPVPVSRESVWWPIETKRYVADTESTAGYLAKEGIAAKSSFISSEQVVGSLSKSIFHPAAERLLSFKSLSEDFDGEGAHQPDHAALELAASFIELLPFFAPQPSVGVNSEGQAVVEFHDDNELGQVIFTGNNEIEAYFATDDAPSTFIEGSINDVEVKRQFRRAFGFPLVA
ncbi:hypothetical protein F9L06_10430 [Brucella anthropi]|uniref:Uncharacterized protein n=1 Tax=Brucella anthropi TaxID=529 RepID=A0A6I0DSK5_BRUAN|nr:hypothetical protein [Brucella anthropi]KAB2799008.1 hypothetical protein F9L06_10430 [Brucella anthropi]